MIRNIIEKFKNYSRTKKYIVISLGLILFLVLFPLPMKCRISGGVIDSHGDPPYINTTGAVYFFNSDPYDSNYNKIIHTCSPLFLHGGPAKVEFHPLLFPEFEALIVKQIHDLYDPYGDASRPEGEVDVIRIRP